ncbi:hypothetical protein RhiLY_04829 [Ceratobasidium sp. AG-Ba]|nr:hypothetical protein RhiLY_04829 [Ceratobasidium sp. AG-Ba]
MNDMKRKARGNDRVPVQMRANNNYATINVKNRENDEASVLSFWKRMIQMRKDYPIMVHRDFTLLSEGDARSGEVNYDVPEDVMVDEAKIIGGNIPTGKEDAKI